MDSASTYAPPDVDWTDLVEVDGHQDCRHATSDAQDKTSEHEQQQCPCTAPSSPSFAKMASHLQRQGVPTLTPGRLRW
jgi:hypothetical protein